MINAGWGQHIDFRHIPLGRGHALHTHLMNRLCLKDVFGPLPVFACDAGLFI